MNRGQPGALFEALRLLELPAGVPRARTCRFPADVGLLIRLLAGDETSLEEARHAHSEAVAVLLDAAEFYLLQVCFTPGVDSYRVLGVNRDAPSEQIREHYRLLVRWLHPDRNSDAWQTVYLDRVNQAWRDLRHPSERAAYDQSVPETILADALPAASNVPAFALAPAGAAPGKRLSARVMRRMPARALAVLGVVAVLALGWFYLDQPDRTGTNAPGLADQTMIAEPSGFMAEPPPVPLPKPVPDELFDEVAAAEPPATPPDTDISPATERASRAAAIVVSAQAASEPAPVSAPTGRPVSVKSARPQPLADMKSSPRLPPADRARASAVVAAVVAEPAPRAPASRVDLAELQPPPAIEAVDAQSAQVPAAQPDPRVVATLLDQFQRAYGAGDLVRLMALFTREARNRPQAKAQGRLADDYRALFATSRARSLSLSHVNWWQESDGLAVVASFEAAVTPIESHRQHLSAGDIYFELRPDGDALRIASVRHQEHAR